MNVTRVGLLFTALAVGAVAFLITVATTDLGLRPARWVAIGAAGLVALIGNTLLPKRPGQ